MTRVLSETFSKAVSRTDLLRRRFAARDRRALEVQAVRHGNFDLVAPGVLSDEWPRPIVANRIDVMARHGAAALAPLPNVSCQAQQATDTARKSADRRTKIAANYLRRSRVQAQMQQGADQFYTYGMLVTSVEPDMDSNLPHIFIEDALGVYPSWDRLGVTTEVARVFTRDVAELKAEFPELEAKIEEAHRGVNDPNITVVKYVDKKRVTMWLDRTDVVLMDEPHPLGRCPYVVTQKPGLDREIRGTFDDLIYVQIALHAMQTYTLSAAQQAVDAPIAVPNDVMDVETGPGAIIRSQTPEKIRRVSLEVPQSAFAASEYLSQEIQYGAIVPEALGGSIDASVVTGKGVQQLMAGYSQQIAMAQESLVGHWEQVIELCFQMDDLFWPNLKKTIRGVRDSNPFQLDYTPSVDIAGDYSVMVQYGGVAGLDPSRGLVFLLQGLGADLISKDYVRRHLPSDINPQDEENLIAVEKLRAASLESLAGWIQSIPAIAAQGGDPSTIVQGVHKVLRLVQKGKSVEDAMDAVWPEPEPDPVPDPAAAAPPEGGGGPDGFGASGLPTGLDVGLASRGPGAKPDLAQYFAGNRADGSPNLQAGVSRMIPAGGGA